MFFRFSFISFSRWLLAFLGKGSSLHMAKISLAKCLSSMNSPASHTQQPHKHRHQQHHEQQQQDQQHRQPTGEKLVEFSHNFIHRHMLQHHNSYNALTENNTKFSRRNGTSAFGAANTTSQTWANRIGEKEKCNDREKYK